MCLTSSNTYVIITFINSMEKAMSSFRVTIQTDTKFYVYPAFAQSAGQAAEEAAERFADVPCGITVTSSEVR